MRKLLPLIALIFLPFFTQAEGWIGHSTSFALKDIKEDYPYSTDYSYGSDGSGSFMKITCENFTAWLYYKGNIIYKTFMKPETTAFKDAMLKVLDDDYTYVSYHHWKTDDTDITYEYNSGTECYLFVFKSR